VCSNVISKVVVTSYIIFSFILAFGKWYPKDHHTIHGKTFEVQICKASY